MILTDINLIKPERKASLLRLLKPRKYEPCSKLFSVGLCFGKSSKERFGHLAKIFRTSTSFIDEPIAKVTGIKKTLQRTRKLRRIGK